ncbi:MAG: TolC family protein [Chitinophagales bacterium]|nr:TolC family protein [Chitinophagales bacterium]
MKSFAQGDTLLLSLSQAQDYAVKNSFTAKNVGLDAKIAKWRTVEILTEGLPKLDASVNYTNNFKLPVTILPGDLVGQPGTDVEVTFGTTNNARLDFQINQLLADGRYFIGLKANRAFLAVAQENIEMTELQVRNAVASAYYAALAAEEGRKIIEGNIATIEQLVYQTTEMYKAGFAEELDVDRLNLSLSNLQAKLSQTTVRRDLTLTVLKFQMGMAIETPINLTDSLEQLMLEKPALVEQAFNYEERSEYQLLKLAKQLRGYDAQRIRAAYFPSLYFQFGYGFNAQRDAFNFFKMGLPWFQTGFFAFQLNIPIFDSYKSGAVYQQKKLEIQKYSNDMENFKLQGNVQYANARSNYVNALSEYQSQKKNVALAQKIFNKVTIMNREGLSSSFELSQAETSLTEAQGNYINSIYNLLVNKTELDKALGKY